MDSPPYSSLERPRAVLVGVFLISAVYYLPWRLGTFNPDAVGFSVLIYAAELFGFLTAALHLFMTWRLTERIPAAADPGLSVDIFVPTINEPVDLVRRTLLAAIHVDYPHQTWLLDDGNRPEMAALASDLGVGYVARPDNRDAKAGNLNYALTRSKAEFVALFDADHAPSRGFLRETLGYFRNPQVAFVQTPQDFFNLDSYQHRWTRNRRVWTEQGLFFRIIQRGKDYWNAAFFCGSCAVMRRSALDAIGGFATGTITEDLHTSLKLHKQGFQSVYHAAPLAFGIAPQGSASFLRQRIRWGQGAMQVWRREGILFCRGLTLAQRLNYFASAVTYFEGWQKIILYFAPAFVLLSGVMPINTLDAEFLARFVPYFLLSLFVFEEVARGYGSTLYTEQSNMARFAAFAWATLGVFRVRLPFRVTPKGASSAQRKFDSLWAQIGVLVANGAAIPVGLVLYARFAHLPLGALTANLIWAGINSGLAFALLRFALHCHSFRRQNYRFPLPLPAQLNLVGVTQGSLGTVDDISPAGFRYHGPDVEKFLPGSRVTGNLHLPSGVLAIKAEVTRQVFEDGEEGPYVKAIGCRFIWKDPTESEALELFLFGSDLQWRLQELDDRSPTPGKWLVQLVSGRRQHHSDARLWAPVLIQPATGQSPQVVGLISIQNHPKQHPTLLTFALLPGGKTRIKIISRTGQREVDLLLSSPTPMASQVGPVYRFQINRETQSWKDVAGHAGQAA